MRSHTPFRGSGKNLSSLCLESLEQRLLLDAIGVWEELGFRSASGGGITDNSMYQDDSYCSLAVSNTGVPFVVYVSTDGLHCQSFANGRWYELTTASPVGSGTTTTSFGQPKALTRPVIAVTPQGTPIVAWIQAGTTAAQDIYAAYWSGSAWLPYGSSSSNGDVSNDSVKNDNPCIAVDNAGYPIIAYTAYDETGNDWEVVCKRWNGNA